MGNPVKDFVARSKLVLCFLCMLSRACHHQGGRRHLCHLPNTVPTSPAAPRWNLEANGRIQPAHGAILILLDGFAKTLRIVVSRDSPKSLKPKVLRTSHYYANCLKDETTLTDANLIQNSGQQESSLSVIQVSQY
ncbi:hypothetical protein GQ44DRAFT_333185 [Phaeosphaeriaceae sp. PMI808]|nr:hypothetical protein GQ44DRAFT_333185 [Phaeosphaeriaceae sp. PMI808]